MNSSKTIQKGFHNMPCLCHQSIQVEMDHEMQLCKPLGSNHVCVSIGSIPVDNITSKK